MDEKTDSASAGYEPIVSADLLGLSDKLMAQGVSGENLLKALIGGTGVQISGSPVRAGTPSDHCLDHSPKLKAKALGASSQGWQAASAREITCRRK